MIPARLNPVTVVICTKDRGPAVLCAARSVLSSTHPSFTLLVIDQSGDDSSERALEPLRADQRLVYLRSGESGLSRARNAALRQAKTGIVVFTDDDCEVPGQWLATMQEVLESHPHALLAFCNVVAGPHDSSLGYVPAYQCSGTLMHTSHGRQTRGMGAGLAVRRVDTMELGGFDEELGVGARFPSAEDRDLVVRTLLADRGVCTTDRTFVTHLGFRTWAEGRELAQRDFMGIGAAHAKPLRAGRWLFLPVAVFELLQASVLAPLSLALRLKRPHGFGRGIHYLRGFAGGLRTPLDRQHLVYRPR
jgi:glycosyltransferase involved in cell wall biosynthesis